MFDNDLDDDDGEAKENKLRERLGIVPTPHKQFMSQEDEVNDFLRRAIDSIDQLRKQNVRPFFLTFSKSDCEDNYYAEGDYLFVPSISMSLFTYIVIVCVNLTVFPRSWQLGLLFGIIFLVITLFLVWSSCVRNVMQQRRKSAVKCCAHYSSVVLSVLIFLAAIAQFVPLSSSSRRLCSVYQNTTTTASGTFTSCCSRTEPGCCGEHSEYTTLSVFLVLIALSVYRHFQWYIKVLLMSLLGFAYTLLLALHFQREFPCQVYKETLGRLWYLVFALACHLYMRERISRLDFLWKVQATQEQEEMEEKRKHNKQLLYTILPGHVAEHFLEHKYEHDLYAEDCPSVMVMFSSISNFSSFYLELDSTGEGRECLRVLNQIIVDFDSLLSQPRYRSIEKIKTMGETYMAASGLEVCYITFIFLFYSATIIRNI